MVKLKVVLMANKESSRRVRGVTCKDISEHLMFKGSVIHQMTPYVQCQRLKITFLLLTF
jgi:hypothetical protein